MKYIYRFDKDHCDGNGSMRNLLGGKGANLAEMSSIGLPVPSGFTLTTEVCSTYYKSDQKLPDGLLDELKTALTWLEQKTGRQFADTEKPLLVSVRSGARVSMPGMMDTVLNLGLNDITVEGLARSTNNLRFALDSYRRFIQMYANVVMGVEHDLFEEVLHNIKVDNKITEDTELSEEALRELIVHYKEIVLLELDEAFPQDPQEQLIGAISAVFKSWMTQRAVMYRRLYQIPEDWGTAVNVQQMVFGNMGDDCATGVAFTRNPSTGVKEFYGEYLVNAQGEDVVAGIRTPQHLTKEARLSQSQETPSLEELMPQAFNELENVRAVLEKHFRDMQDIEFTIEQGKLYMLQTRSGKRTAQAAIKIAVDMVSEGLIDKNEGLLRIDPRSLDQLLHPSLDPNAHKEVIATGLPASPGAASGIVCLTSDEAEERTKQGHKTMLVRAETSPEDIHGMHAAQGILTARGGMTSHAAVVARGMGRPCVSGAGEISINEKERVFLTRGRTIKAGDWITIDGSTGEVMLGQVETIQPELSEDFNQMMIWADDVREMKIRANAETPVDVQQALDFGAEGIGLCRTEHMFFDEDRIASVRAMILASNDSERKQPLEQLLPMQRSDFKSIFTIMSGFPVTIRLLDPPLHEFLPRSDEDFLKFAKSHDIPVERARARAIQLEETNPMLGHRGCRLLNSYPEIAEMQARAIFEAWLDVKTEGVTPPELEIMIPLVSYVKELSRLKDIIDQVAKDIEQERNDTIDYIIGTMIELPRAALIANEIAEHAEFFSFGTNDLTQTTFGISRDDSASFFGDYFQLGIFEQDPFVSIDPLGVGELVKIGAKRGRQTRSDIKLGICGEHGGDPASIEFCAEVGLNYVSCSPFRVPIARLAAAQAQIKAISK